MFTAISDSTSQDAETFQFSDARAMAVNEGLQGATCGSSNSHLSRKGSCDKKVAGPGGVAQTGHQPEKFPCARGSVHSVESNNVTLNVFHVTLSTVSVL